MAPLSDDGLPAQPPDDPAAAGEENWWASVRNDPAAVNKVAEQLYPTVYRYLYRQLGKTHDAQDVSQEVFLALLQRASLAVFSDETHLVKWLICVAHNKARNHFKSRWRKLFPKGASPLPDTLAGSSHFPLDRLGDDERAACIHAQIALLPAGQRAAIKAVWIEGLTYEDAAERLGIPVGTAKTRVHYGLERLRPILQSLGLDPDSIPVDDTHA